MRDRMQQKLSFLEAELAAARQQINELRQMLADKSRERTKLNTARMIAQRDAEISVIKLGHLTAKLTRQDEYIETLKRLLHANELKLPPFSEA